MKQQDHGQAFDTGLERELAALNARANRRKVLAWIAAAGLAPAPGRAEQEAEGSTGAGGQKDQLGP